ncbi:amidohydrolase family protein [Stenotrophomonas sp. GD04145]|uniref:amidohydrolase family protein n=1 Tax=Stenotrophomonas sp. GD04145 TaxID=2975436 RepID=UPI002447CBED|nr:amidohydrolase family protein [Stenotrophomonas sp. GD04145]MDH0170228.1 amidohydrolase family protein [Stenotrophomonas sp. GD04145]
MFCFRPLSLAVLFACAPLSAAAAERADLLIRNATVVDVEHARTLPGQSVVIRGETIVAVGPDAGLEGQWRADRQLDAQGKYLIPGLWDMHVHFGGGPALIEENKALLPLYVAHGITTVRDCSGDLPQQVLQWRGEIAAGTLFGPRLLSSGAKIEGIKPVWKGTIEVGSRADADQAITRLQRDKVDFVKITDSTLTPELFLYSAAVARKAGFRASGHIPMALTVEQAVDAGLASIEHLDYAFKAGSRDEARIAADFGAGRIDRAEANRQLDASFDRDTAMRAYRDFARRGVFVTPTLNGGRILDFLDQDDHAHDPYLAYIGPGLRATYQWRVERAAKATPAQIQARHAQYRQVAAVLPMLQEAGVTIIAGTDAGFLNSFNYPGIGLHQELQLFVQEGLTPPQALSAATRSGPAWFGQMDRYGSVADGKAADLVLLTANPLQDIAATRQIDSVILRGHVHDRAALDQMLADTRARVAAWNDEADKARSAD